jgi:hypothetical protein
MKVKVGNLIFDPDDVQIAIYLTQRERAHIADMADDAAIYCQYPEHMDPEMIEVDLQQFREQVENEE